MQWSVNRMRLRRNLLVLVWGVEKGKPLMFWESVEDPIPFPLCSLVAQTMGSLLGRMVARIENNGNPQWAQVVREVNLLSLVKPWIQKDRAKPACFVPLSLSSCLVDVAWWWKSVISVWGTEREIFGNWNILGKLLVSSCVYLVICTHGYNPN